MSDYRDLRVVYSHPEALAQCAGFIERHKLEPRPFYDTAGAAKMLARENPRAAAAIASPLAADLYDLAILKEGIDDGPPSSTRFLLLAKEPRPSPPAGSARSSSPPPTRPAASSTCCGCSPSRRST